MYQLSIDHTWAEEAIRAGRPAEEIRSHPNRGVILRYLGIDPTVSIDTRYRTLSGDIVEGLEGPLILEPGDTLLLCSDGVSDATTPQLMAELMAYPDCHVAAEALVSSALQNGTTDNATALVARLPGGKVVAPPPAAGRVAAKRRSPLPIILALLGLLIVVGVVGYFALMRRGDGQGSQEPQSAPTTAVQMPAAAGVSVVPAPQNDSGGSGGVQVATAAPGAARPTAASGAQPAAGAPTLIPTNTVAPTGAPPTAAPNASANRATTTAPSGPSAGGTSTGGVKLEFPPPNESINGRYTFQWVDSGGFRLAKGQKYELIIWGVDEQPIADGRSPVGATENVQVLTNLPDLEATLRLSAGRTFYWGVALFEGEKRVRMLSEARQFTYNRPPSGGGGGGAPGCTGVCD